jgi:hypothetical protein
MKPILNYFVPFTNGKFVANCLMLSEDVCGKPNELAVDRPWHQNEYSDIDFWWKDHQHDWFNTENWQDYLNPIPENKYAFYTCHENYSVHHIKRLVPNSRIITIVPEYDLCKNNYIKKNWIESETVFEESRVFSEFEQFRPIYSDLVIYQSDLFQLDSFTKTIEYLCKGLNISLDMKKVLSYRNYYFSHPSNQL